VRACRPVIRRPKIRRHLSRCCVSFSTSVPLVRLLINSVQAHPISPNIHPLAARPTVAAALLWTVMPKIAPVNKPPIFQDRKRRTTGESNRTNRRRPTILRGRLHVAICVASSILLQTTGLTPPFANTPVRLMCVPATLQSASLHGIGIPADWYKRKYAQSNVPHNVAIAKVGKV
jgi:hypothetical protein